MAANPIPSSARGFSGWFAVVHPCATETAKPCRMMGVSGIQFDGAGDRGRQSPARADAGAAPL
jgi:hypothetical protein